MEVWHGSAGTALLAQRPAAAWHRSTPFISITAHDAKGGVTSALALPSRCFALTPCRYVVQALSHKTRLTFQDGNHKHDADVSSG